jgi:hypothetical protein
LKRTRQLHLWIGMICSLFILMQSITGLLLSEKWLTGSGGMEMMPPQGMSQSNTGASPLANQASGITAPAAAGNQGTAGAQQGDRPAFNGAGGPGPGQGGANGVSGIIKGLHEGKIGNTNVNWLVDLTAIAMIFLTITGITLSLKTLRGQSISRKKRRTAEA